MIGDGGYLAIGACFVCSKSFRFNPARVPSFQGEPMCYECVQVVNAERRVRKLPEWEIYPDSYSIADFGQL